MTSASVHESNIFITTIECLGHNDLQSCRAGTPISRVSWFKLLLHGYWRKQISEVIVDFSSTVFRLRLQFKNLF